jgi:anthranilate phosphoribosyltransferase
VSSSDSAARAWPDVLASLAAGRQLTVDQAGWAMEQVLAGAATSAQFGAFVMGLRAKGESPSEVAALVATMLEHARLLDFGPAGAPLSLDVVGTGGDQAHTVNISTMAALVCAASGVPVVKHGNRAASSSTGTADVLEELGVAIDLEPDAVVRCVQDAGIGFCFAQVHHPGLRHAGPWRRELGIPTVFNILGPLTNPGGARAALIGTSNEVLAPVMADVLAARGVRALVVRGVDGLDEVTTTGPTRVWDATGGTVQQTQLDAADLGIPRHDPSLLRGGDRVRNAQLLMAALGGGSPEGEDGDRIVAIRDAVAINAAAALAAFASARSADAGEDPPSGNLTERVATHVPVARQVLADGAAQDLLVRWAALSSGLRG